MRTLPEWRNFVSLHLRDSLTPKQLARIHFSRTAPLVENVRQVEIRSNQADMPVALQNAHDTRGDLSRHVTSLLDGRHQMIVFRRQQKDGPIYFGEAVPGIKVPQQLQTIDIPFAGGATGHPDELFDVLPVCMPGMKPKRRKMTHQRHHTPWQNGQTRDGQPQSPLRREIGKRIENHQCLDLLGMLKGERQGDGTAKGFTDDEGATLCGSHGVDHVGEIASQDLEIGGIIA
jgi:hypothetical protein